MKRGVVLGVSLVILSVLLVLGTGYTTYFVHEKLVSDRYLAGLQAFYIAEAGLDRSLSRLNATGLGGDILEDFGQGGYFVTVGGNKSEVRSTGEVKDEQGRILASRTLVLHIKAEEDHEPFNVYSYLTDDEHFTRTYCSWFQCWTVQEPVWFTTGDELKGPVFTNSKYNISGGPQFDGRVQSVADELNYQHGGPPVDNPWFNPEYNPSAQEPHFGAESILLPDYDSDPDLQRLKEDGLKFSGDTTIEFKDDETMDVGDVNMPIPASGGIFVEGGNLFISGILKGEVTVGASVDGAGNKGNIVIKDNLRYASRYDEQGQLREPDPDDPDYCYLPEDSDDYLGVVAERNIIISKDAPDNLEINGSMMALGDSFIVESWYDSNYNKDTLMVLGGIIQKERGPVGTFSTAGKLSGYSKYYVYDERFEDKVLPFFPKITTYTYVAKSWERE